jgi:hypothetical protein
MKFDEYLRLCDENGVPCFVGKSGCCDRCGRDVLEELDCDEFVVITGCRFCNRSFCE